MPCRLDRIERAINDLYVHRLVFSRGKVRRMLLEVQMLRRDLEALGAAMRVEAYDAANWTRHPQDILHEWADRLAATLHQPEAPP